MQMYLLFVLLEGHGKKMMRLTVSEVNKKVLTITTKLNLLLPL